MTGTAPRWRPRWYHWTVVGLVILIATPIAVGIAVRLVGFRECDRALAELRAAGEPTDVAALTATWPPTDRGRQAALASWMTDLGRGGDDPTSDPPWNEWVYHRGEASTAMRAVAKRHAAATAAGRALLDSGPLHFGAVGWIDEHAGWARCDLPTHDDRSVRHYAALLRYAAVEADDPSIALRDLARLLDAGRTCAIGVDLDLAIALGRQRDLAHLECLVHHRLGRTSLTAWFAEAPWQRLAAADAMRGDRVQIARSIAAMRQALMPDRVAMSGFFDMTCPPDLRLNAAIFAPGDAAIVLRGLFAYEQRLRGRRASPVDPRTFDRYRDTWARWVMAWHEARLYDAWLAEASHRAMRLAADLILAVRDVDSAPAIADLHGLIPDLALRLTGDDWRATLAITLEGARTWRIAIDPLTAMPDIIAIYRSQISGTRLAAPLQSRGPACLVEVPAP